MTTHEVHSPGGCILAGNELARLDHPCSSIRESRSGASSTGYRVCAGEAQ